MNLAFIVQYILKKIIIVRASYISFHVVFVSLQVIYFIWKPPSSCFFKVYFDSSIQKRRAFGNVSFIIRSISGALVHVGGVKIFDMIISIEELHVVWEGLNYTT